MIVLKVNTQRVEYMLSKLQREIPNGGEEGITELLRFSAKTYLKQAKVAGITAWRGKLFNSLELQAAQPNKYSRFSGYITMPYYAPMLDSMQPHWVALRRGRMITKWAMDKLSLGPRVTYLPIRKIYVKPHPFISQSNRIIGQNVRRIFETIINRKIRGSKQ